MLFVKWQWCQKQKRTVFWADFSGVSIFLLSLLCLKTTYQQAQFPPSVEHDFVCLKTSRPWRVGGGWVAEALTQDDLSPGPEFLGLRPALQETGTLQPLQQQSPASAPAALTPAAGVAPRRDRRRLEELQEMVLERELRRIELEEKKLIVETQKLQLEKDNLELEKQKLQLEIGHLQSNLRHSRNLSGRWCCCCFKVLLH